MTKKEIILNGEKWIVDFETGTIYKNLEMIPNGTGTLPMLGRYGDYPFKVFRNALYFETNDKFYKVYADEVMEITKEEYQESRNYIKLNKNDPSALRFVSKYVTSVILDEVMEQQFGLKVSIPVENSNNVNLLSRNFTPKIENYIKKISKSILAIMPNQINRETIKQQIKDIYKNDISKNDELHNTIINSVYLSNKERFDYLSEDIIRSRNARKNSRK